jgi:hypothetical protein
MVHSMRADPILWMETNLKIRTKEGIPVPFKLNSFQRKLVTAVMDSVRADGDAFFVVLKGRQLGISSVCRGMMLWRAMNYVGQQCVFSAHTDPDTKRSMTSLREMIHSINPFYRYQPPSLLSDSRILWRGSGSAIEARLASGKSQGRSSQINFLHATEVDYYDDVAAGCWQKFKTGILPSMKVRGAIAIVESTCQGRKALYDLYTQSLDPQSKWKHMFFPWYDNPEYVTADKYDLTERELADMEKYNLTAEQAYFRAGYRMECGELACDREYPNCILDCFASSGSKGLLTGELVEACMDRSPWPLQGSEPVIIGVDFGAAAKNSKKYFNRRAEMYDALSQWMIDGVAIPRNSKLANELLSIEVNDRREGRLILQPKHKLAKSPDLADACALTMAHDGVPYFRHSAVKILPRFR